MAQRVGDTTPLTLFQATVNERERFFLVAGLLIVAFAGMSIFSNTPIVILLVLGPLALLSYVGLQRLKELTSTAQTLQESEERFRTLVDEVSDYAIFVINPKGYVVSWNSGAMRINGYSAREIIGQPLYWLRYGEAGPSQDIVAALEIAQTKGRFEEEAWYLRKDGTRFLSNTVITPLEASGKQGFSVIMCDVTAKRKAEQDLIASHQFIQRITDTIPNMLFIYDLEHREKVYLNTRAAESLGYTKDMLTEMGPQFFNKVVHPDELPIFEEQMGRSSYQKDGESLEFELRLKDAREEWHNCNFRTVVFSRDANNKGLQILGIVQDITALRNARERVVRLEREALSKQRLALMGELSAGVAHELRNPLLGLQHCIENLREQCADDPKMLPTISLLEEGLDRMDHISGRLLRLARRDDGEKTLTDITQCINISCAFIRTRAQKAGISLHTVIQPGLPKMLVHGERISEALLNLLSNSIDACAVGDSITIKVDLKSDKNNVLEILIADTGSGIPKEIRPQIFNAFFTTKPFGKGTGLGMTIVKKVVDAHGGSVEILDTERGTSILLRLPVG